jgi:iron complex outermembrane receptor protein
MSGHSIGLELALDWHPAPWWRLQASYTHLDFSIELDDDSQDVWESAEIIEGASPEHQITLRSLMDLSKEWEADLWIYYVDELPVSSIGAQLLGTTIDSYTSLNARIGWKPSDDLDISLVGLNLQDDKHSEFVSEYFIPMVEVERSVYLKVTWDF